MSAMFRRSCRVVASAAMPFLFAFASAVHGQNADLKQYLRDHYQGKIFALRGFYPGDHLYYDSSGAPVGGITAGDWTGDGFVLVTDIHASGDRLVIEGRRVVVTMTAKQFQLHPMGDPPHGIDNEKRAVFLKIEADLGAHHARPEQADAAISKIFLGAEDSLSEMVPGYWKACVINGLRGTNDNCRFSAEISAIPGVSTPGNTGAVSAAAEGDAVNLSSKPLHVGKGISPPKLIYHREPEFNDRARQEKYQGTMTLGLVVNTEGVPTRIHVLSPLGCGLDAKAVQAVSSWKFQPAEKDGQAVPVEIAVEVDFHLY